MLQADAYCRLRYLDLLGAKLHVSQSWRRPPPLPDEVHDQDVVLDKHGRGARDAGCHQSLQIPHLLFGPNLLISHSTTVQ